MQHLTLCNGVWHVYTGATRSCKQPPIAALLYPEFHHRRKGIGGIEVNFICICFLSILILMQMLLLDEVTG